MLFLWNEHDKTLYKHSKIVYNVVKKVQILNEKVHLF